MIRLGFSPAAITEAAFLIVDHCFMQPDGDVPRLPSRGDVRASGQKSAGPAAAADARDREPPLGPRADRFQAARPGAPFAEITNALSGLPAAYLLHEALTGAFDSPVLSRRVKALMFGVVARMLECRFCLPQSLQAAAGGGVRDGRGASRTGDPELAWSSTRTRRLILSWVRETVRYNPSQIQKRTRALSAAIGTEAMLEAVGVAALANATVRLGMLLE